MSHNTRVFIEISNYYITIYWKLRKERENSFLNPVASPVQNTIKLKSSFKIIHRYKLNNFIAKIKSY